MTAGFETKLVTGIAQLLATDGVGSWNPDGSPYDPAQTGIYLRLMPEQADNAIALGTYPLGDSATLSDAIVGLQIATRCADPDPSVVDDLDEQIFQFLHGLWAVQLPTGVYLTLCVRTSGTSLGQDNLKRWSRTANYQIQADHQSLNRQGA